MTPSWDIDYLPEEEQISIYPVQEHLSKQDQGRKILQNFYSKFESKTHEILNIESVPTQSTDFLESKPENKSVSTPEEKTEKMGTLLQNMVDNLPLETQEARLQSLSQIYESLIEPTENCFSLTITETGQEKQNILIPELIQNFSHDFWLRKIKTKVVKGESISDEDLVYLLLIRLKFADIKQRGFVLEDFPENLKQKRILDSHGVIPHLVFLIDGVLESREKALSASLIQLSYLRHVRTTLRTLDPVQLMDQIMSPPPSELTIGKPSDADLSEDEEQDSPSPLSTYTSLLEKFFSNSLSKCVSSFHQKKPQISLLASIVASKLLLQNRFELLTVLYLYKEQYDNVRVLNCYKDPLFNLLLVKKSLRCMKAKLSQVLSYELQNKAYRVSGLGLSRSNILKNLAFVGGQFICALDFVKRGKRELLECTRENMVVLGDMILPVKSNRIQEVVDK